MPAVCAEILGECGMLNLTNWPLHHTGPMLSEESQAGQVLVWTHDSSGQFRWVQGKLCYINIIYYDNINMII